MRKSLTLLTVLLLGATLVACGGRRSLDEGVKVDEQSGSIGTDSSSGLGADEGVSGSGFGEVGADDPLSKTTVYFDYDSSELTLESEDIARAHAQNMLANPDTQIVVEGHADERGTREYNLALGERRAQSVARFMQAMGVTGDRMQTISYGEERPVALDRNDEAWGLNRRVELIYSY